MDYRNGTVHIRAEVMEKPAGGENTTWTLCYIPNKGQGNNYGCTGTGMYREKGVYEQDVAMTSWWENKSIIWEEPISMYERIIARIERINNTIMLNENILPFCPDE